MAHRFRKLVGNRDQISATEWNALVDLALKLERSLMASGFSDSSGIYTRRTGQGLTGTQIHRAFCAENATAATTITCYLDTDTTGTEIEVTCTISGGGALNTAEPVLTDGLEIPVWYDSTLGTPVWKCFWGFQRRQGC